MHPHSSPAPELLAPAGDWDALRAAVANGADAVYFGLAEFNARHRATNFSGDELPQVMEFLHRRNVRGYLAMNTLIFSDELPSAAGMIETAAAAGVDALIVQDLGLARLIRRLAPGLAIHGSTQMTLTERRGIDFVREVGVERVILARELSLDEIRAITAATATPVEVFVHGALCVAYSGQCLTSEALGGRSANRGQCAQACRLPYELVVDGETRDFGDRAYLLSPTDLAAHDLLLPLLRAGVCSIKIEGRLKSAHYVAATVKAYRAALDAAVAGEDFDLARQERLDLQQSFSRGFTRGFLDGVDHQSLVPARFPKSRGVRVGTVVQLTARSVIVELGREHTPDFVRAGDGLVFDEGRPDQDEQGGRVYGVRSLRSHPPASNNQAASNRPERLEITFAEGAINLAALSLGCLVWKTDDPRMRRRLENSFARDHVPRRIPIQITLEGHLGGPLVITASDPHGLNAQTEWAGPLEVARKHPITPELLWEQLGRLGDTPFELCAVVNRLPDGCMLPKSVLNDLRRELAAQLVSARDSQHDRAIHRQALTDLRQRIALETNDPADQTPQLHVLVRSLAQLEAVIERRPADGLPRPASVICDFEDLRRYRDAVARARAGGLPVGLATLRINKPQEEGVLAQISRAGADFLLVRNLAGLTYLRERVAATPLVGDYSLNVANELTADLFLQSGLSRLVPSYDLSWEQLSALLGRVDVRRLECVIHQHMPMFHMEHCVFAAMLSDGKDWRDCGRPCDRHKVELRDRAGAEFPLLADTGCRNTVFNTIPQSAAEYVPRMLSAGVRHFRVELLREPADQIPPLLDRYARILAGQETGRLVFRQLQVLNQLGVTRGTLR